MSEKTNSKVFRIRTVSYETTVVLSKIEYVVYQESENMLIVGMDSGEFHEFNGKPEDNFPETRDQILALIDQANDDD